MHGAASLARQLEGRIRFEHCTSQGFGGGIFLSKSSLAQDTGTLWLRNCTTGRRSPELAMSWNKHKTET